MSDLLIVSMGYELKSEIKFRLRYGTRVYMSPYNMLHNPDSFNMQRYVTIRVRVSSPLRQHILDGAPVATFDFFLQLFFGEPLEVLETELVLFQVNLASHYTRLHKESLRSMFGEES